MSLQDLLKKNNISVKTATTSTGSGLKSLLEKPVVEPYKPTLNNKGQTVLQAKLLPNAKIIPDNFIPVGQDIKVPFIQKGITVPSGGAIGAGYSAIKSLVEFPEKGLRSLLEIGGISKQKEIKQWRVPSYSETVGKNTAELIDSGIPPTAAVIFSSTMGAGEFANDALIFDAILGQGVRSIASKVIRDETSTVAYDFLGRPKTLSEAEKAFKAIQKEFHPDISGSDVISKQANNAITILRKNGIPTKNILQTGLDNLLNKPLSDLFKKPIVAEAPIKPTLALPERGVVGKPPAPIGSIEKPTPTIQSEVKPEVVKVPGEQLPVGTGETQVSRLEARMKEQLSSITADEAKTAGISTYEQMVKPDQMRAASEYVTSNPTEALDVVMGKIPAPKGLLNNSIALALESQADLLGNAELVAKLSSLRSTRLGQEISILTEADPLSSTNVSRQIQISREKDILKKTGKTPAKAKADMTKEIDTIIKEERTLAQLKVEEAEKLLDSLIC